jgi:hypothetical protein
MDIEEMSSWGLTKAIYDVIENGFMYDEETGEVYFTADDLDALNEAFDTKLNNICGFIKSTEAKVDSLKQRKAEVDENIKYYEKRVEKLTEFLKALMLANNIDKKELADYRLGTRKSTSVSIDDEEAAYTFLEAHPQFKETCVKTETKTSLIKKGLKEIMDEQQIPGVSIVENKNITIK